MKKAGILAAAAIASVIIAAPAASADDITVMVNGEQLVTEAPPVISNDRTLVPLRAITEALGCDVSWDSTTRGITITNGENLCFTWIDKDHAFVASPVSLQSWAALEAPPVIMNDFTMVPLRAMSEIFGAEVDWDDETRTVTVNLENPDNLPPAESGLAEKYMIYEQLFNENYDAYCNYVEGTPTGLSAEIELDNGNKIELHLHRDIAPETVDNFVKLAESGFYDGLIFHRVINGFMIQGGGFDENFVQKDADNIKGEFIANGFFNMIPHVRGIISMARTRASNDSASSQFFIMHRNAESLDGQYAAFGYVTSGMEFVDEIAEGETIVRDDLGMEDVPVNPPVIKTIKIIHE